MQANRYLHVTVRKKFHIIYFVAGYRAKNPFNLGDRAYLYFYHFTLIMFMNKRLTLTPTANFASQNLQLYSSPGCVQPCPVYDCSFYLESIVDKPHQPQAPKLMHRCRDLSRLVTSRYLSDGRVLDKFPYSHGSKGTGRENA